MICLKVSQVTANASLGTIFCHRCELDVTHLFHIVFANITRSVPIMRYEAKAMFSNLDY